MDEWIPIQTLHNVLPHTNGLYWQQVSMTRYCKRIARLEYGREQEGNFFIELEFWPKGSIYVNSQDRYLTLRKHLLKICIRHHYTGCDIGSMKQFYIRPDNDEEVLRAIDDMQNSMYKDIDSFMEKYKGIDGV